MTDAFELLVEADSDCDDVARPWRETGRIINGCWWCYRRAACLPSGP
jgi:hypothetical protein